MPLKQIACAAAAMSLLCCASLAVVPAGDAQVVTVLLGAAAPLPMLPAPVMNSPFSCVTERRRVNTLPDGSHTDILETTSRMYRDSDGRVRTEVGELLPPGALPKRFPQNTVMISDPIAVRTYRLDQQNRTAHVTIYSGDVNVEGVTTSQLVTSKSTLAMHAQNEFNRTGERPATTWTSLGDDTILGVPVTGRRMTLVFPIGSAGNDQPATVTMDYWDSKDLHITLFYKVDDPREGVTITRVTQLDLTEPAASLFQIPADYTIVD